MKKIYIYKNNHENSIALYNELKKLLSDNSCLVTDDLESDTELMICIGGDGTLLNALNSINFASVPILGINTGHMGFFSEIDPDETDKLLELIQNDDFEVQKHHPLLTTVETEDGFFELSPALNDADIKRWCSSLIHLNLFIGDSFVESFSGDGLLISSPAGSTAYNYSLGGSIVDPRLKLLQITPLAPANNATYRSFTSSIIVPPDQKIILEPTVSKNAMVIIDGAENTFSNVKKISVKLSKEDIQIVKLPDSDFWSKVKSKFL